MKLQTILLAVLLFLPSGAWAQAHDPARYTPAWIRDGFVTGGTTHEPWLYRVRRNDPGHDQWEKEMYDYRLGEEYIRSLAEAGITVYHVHAYKGFGFAAEKDGMEKAARAAALAHEYGLKVDTYVQWNTFGYETFLDEVPEARKPDPWYQVDVTGKPILLPYGYQQAFRWRPCFNHDAYMTYLKEKILRFVIEEIETDFIHFDNFNLSPPGEECHNPATVRAFRNYLKEKYTPAQRERRFGFSNISQVRPPLWNRHNPADGIMVLRDPMLQEWTDFRAWTMTSRLAELVRFVREINKEVVIEVNAGGLEGGDRWKEGVEVGGNPVWMRGINHPDLMQYTNVIWAEGKRSVRWENGAVVGKFRSYMVGRTTGNFVMSYKGSPQDWAENMALNRTIAWIGSGVPEEGSTRKAYLAFWEAHKDLYTDVEGAARVAVLRNYPSMAYDNVIDHQSAAFLAEQALYQRQIPFDIIFDQQLSELDDYDVLVLANQEALSEEIVDTVVQYVERGGGLVVTGNTGLEDEWRRTRRVRALGEIFGPEWANVEREPAETFDFFPFGGAIIPNEVRLDTSFGEGRAVYLPKIEPTGGAMPANTADLIDAVRAAAEGLLPLSVRAPEWVGVSHDAQAGREIIHLFSYRDDRPAAGIELTYAGRVERAWTVSPESKGREALSLRREGGATRLQVPEMEAYRIVVLEK